MPGKKIVVDGGGFGGTAAAITLRSKLDIEHEVLLFDKNKRTFLCGSLPSLVVGERQSTKISRSLGSLKKRGIEHIQSTVNKIDLSAKTVTSHSGTFDYDYLVLSPGAKYDWNAVPGSKDNYSFYEHNGSITARVYENDLDISSINDLVAVFVGSEQRGVARASEVPVFLGGGYAFLTMVYSNATSGETLTFQYYRASTDEVLDISNTIEFTANMVVGDVTDPFMLSISAGTVEFIVNSE